MSDDDRLPDIEAEGQRGLAARPFRKLERIEDDYRGQVTYEVADGKWITLNCADVREHGLDVLMKFHGVEVPKGRIPVFQRGRKIGTVPASFEPMAIRSRSFFYDARPGDFTRTADGWEAAATLGPGDLDAVPDFLRDGEHAGHAPERMLDEARSVLRSLTGCSFGE